MIRFGFHPGKGSENVAVEHLSPPGTPVFRHYGAIGLHENSKRYSLFPARGGSAGTLPIIRVPRSKNGAGPYEFRKRIRR
ncbi:hypothetical protein AGR4C_Lc130083 [Agrobacterium tumefaciens str. Kerr 14]|uniref:Uncharacterized protein n=1 Tax=Agrobacterium tumefaciens str. Kerr 14 TaxID=1183424 RepID=A0A1S7RD24_AGRTU|nr:hypothetical protein AGR4C_Lc130083 [Agrobacterium tumefaciens str. Kerr 14]